MNYKKKIINNFKIYFIIIFISLNLKSESHLYYLFNISSLNMFNMISTVIYEDTTLLNDLKNFSFNINNKNEIYNLLKYEVFFEKNLLKNIFNKENEIKSILINLNTYFFDKKNKHTRLSKKFKNCLKDLKKNKIDKEVLEYFCNKKYITFSNFCYITIKNSIFLYIFNKLKIENYYLFYRASIFEIKMLYFLDKILKKK